MANITRRRFTSSASLALGGFAGMGLSACSAEPDAVRYEAAVAQTWRATDEVGHDGAVPASQSPQALGRELVRLAVLAPSSHNTQCWKFALEDKAVVIHPDLARRCPVVDPDYHHVFVSLRCACENLVQAAQAHGLNATARFDVAQNAIRVALEPMPAQANPSSLFRAIAARQCTRGDYEGQPLSSEELGLLERAGTSSGVPREMAHKENGLLSAPRQESRATHLRRRNAFSTGPIKSAASQSSPLASLSKASNVG